MGSTKADSGACAAELPEPGAERLGPLEGRRSALSTPTVLRTPSRTYRGSGTPRVSAGHEPQARQRLSAGDRIEADRHPICVSQRRDEVWVHVHVEPRALVERHDGD